MRTEKQIRKRLRQLMFRAYQKRARAELKVVPQNCAFNRQTSTTYPDGTPFRVCGLALDQEDRQIVGCNEPGEASACATFVHRTDKAAVKAALESELKDSEMGSREHPAVHALMWVLEEDQPKIEEPDPPWWQFWKRYRRRP